MADLEVRAMRGDEPEGVGSAISVGPWTPSTTVSKVLRGGEQWLERWTATPRWAIKVATGCMALGVLLAGPSYQRVSRSDEQWSFILSRSRGNLISQEGFDEFSRSVNLTWRVAPRVVGWVFHFSEPWHYLVLQFAFGFVLLWAFALLFEEALEDRVLSALLTFAVVCTWAGSCAWVETRGNFDAIALACIALMMLTRVPLVALLVGLFGAFTDEVVILALPFVIIFHLYRGRRGDERVPVKDAINPMTAAICFVPLVTYAVREFFRQRYQLLQLTNLAPGNPWAQLNNYPAAIWTALEGLWLFVAAGLVAIWHRRDRWVFAVTVIVMGLMFTVGVSVFDITRRVMFLLPAVTIAAVWLRDADRTWLRRCVWLCTLLSLAWPVTYAGGEQTLNWAYPAPLQIIRAVFRLGG